MALSNNLISQFVKVTDDTDKSKKEKSTYGTVKEYNGEKYVQIDGSNMLTPYFSTTIVKDGDRVVVDLKDHNAVVSGNITSPATRSDDFNAEVTNTAENFKATNASIDTLKVKQGQFEELATEKLNAAEANIDTLTTRVGEFESATAENFTATNASIENLSGDFANFKVTTTDSLTANDANITKVSGDLADFITVTTDTFKSTDAEITNLKTAKADIDLANIDVVNIGILFNEVGLIDRATIVDGHITGFLDAVEINADSITAGTLIADRILLKGSENGLLYQLNNLGELTSTNVDTLDGSILTERTVTADKLVANSITANELDVTNIFGNSAVLSTLTSQQAFINAISTNKVVVGAYNKSQSIIDNIYTPNTTTIDGGKITTGSVTAKQIDVDSIFAQDITATGTITGATLKGTNIEAINGSIGNFTISDGVLSSNSEEKPLIGCGESYGITLEGITSSIWEAGGVLNLSLNAGSISFNNMANYSYQGIWFDGELSIGLDKGEMYTPCLNTQKIECKGNIACSGAMLLWGAMRSKSDVIAGYGTDNQVSLQTLNSNLGYPDYAYSSSLKKINDTGAHKDESVTISNNGFVFFRAANATTTSIFWRLKINDFTVSEGHTISRNYTYATTAIYPVKKGDVVKISCSNQTSASLYFFPLRKA